MHLSLDADERQWRDAIREYAQGVTWERMQRMRDEIHDLDVLAYSLEFRQDLAAHDWIGLSWPEPYGRALSETVRFAFQEELEVQGLPGHTVVQNDIAAGMIVRFGTSAQLAEHLPHIAKAEWRYVTGLSEPDVGSDLFRLKTSAVRDGDYYVVNGSKMWTSLAHHAHWMTTLVRTVPGTTGPEGLSILLVNLKWPGVEIRPVRVLGGFRVNVCYLTDVRVPANCLVGEENKATQVLGGNLKTQRAMSFGGTECRLLASRLLFRLAGRAPDLTDQELTDLGQMVMDFEADRMLYLQVATGSTRDEDGSGVAATNKLFGSELAQRFVEWAGLIVGEEALYPADGPGVARDVLAADVEEYTRVATMMTIIDGTSEIQRNTIARRVLGLPKGV